jgi:hypothetical protein
MTHKRYACIAIFSLFLCSSFFGQATGRKASYIPYDDAQPILQALAEDLPAELKGKSADEIKAQWPAWVARRDAEIRRRLIQGDEDSLVNFLLFGTSFTRQARITGEQVIILARQALQKRLEPALAAPAAEEAATDMMLKTRISDLIKGMSVPGNNERLLFARHLVVTQKGHNLQSPAGREQIKKYLLSSLARVLSEQASYAKALEAARLLGDPREEFYERSKLYRTRGLSLDTSLLPDFAIEEALKAMKERGLLKEGSVRHVAIVGPGLDFTDKQEGYDFYPQQSIQPFAVIDSLLRLGLASPGDLQLKTLDLSPRINEHLARAKRLAQGGTQYVVQLPRNLEAQWKPGAVAYWERFGDQIGAQAPPVTVPADLSGVKVRAVRVKPAVVAKVTPVDLNIVMQRLEPAPAERFDLIIATNILVYYDAFEQSLAMSNVRAMLQPGGFLLANNALPEFPFLPLHATGYVTVTYSDRPNDGEHMVWYQHKDD